MAMRFSQAQRAQTPDILGGTVEQGRIAAQLREAEQARNSGNLMAGVELADAAGWLGGAEAGAGAATAGAEALGATAGAEAGGAGFLSAMGPMGWAALAALALGATQ